MSRHLPRLALVVPLLVAVMAGCSSPQDDPAAISADDHRQLNDAAAMLDANSMEAHTPPRSESSPHD